MKKSAKAIISILLGVFVLGTAAFLLTFKWELNTPLDTHKKTIFEVKTGERTFDVGSRLQNQCLIRSDWVFYLNAKIKGDPLLPGIYEISSDQTSVEIYRMIANGDTKIVKVTIPEGYRTEQIGKLLATKKIVDYNSFMAEAKQYDGKLFPDTYFLSPDNSVKEIVSMMTDNFKEKTNELNLSQEDLIVASIVEREATDDADRALIAGIYKNRIKKGMKLESDPTVRYALDDELLKTMTADEVVTFDFWKQKVILSQVRSFKSPYNTYYVTGVPAGPICNPGLKSIEDTINSQDSNYLYFLSDSSGKIYPSETLEQHNLRVKEILGSN